MGRQAKRIAGCGVSLLGVLAGAVWLAAAFSNPTSTAGSPAVGVYLTVCQGDVQVWVDSWGRWQNAFPQMRLAVGDQVRTGAGASAQIEFGSRAVARLAEKTVVVVLRDQVTLDGAGAGMTGDAGGTASGAATGTVPSAGVAARAKPALRVQVGLVWVQVAKGVSQLFDFVVETPTAWAGVRGTVFTVLVEADGSTVVTVEDGVVEVSAAGTAVLVKAGERARVPAQPRGSPPYRKPADNIPAGKQLHGKRDSEKQPAQEETSGQAQAGKESKGNPGAAQPNGDSGKAANGDSGKAANGDSGKAANGDKGKAGGESG